MIVCNDGQVVRVARSCAGSGEKELCYEMLSKGQEHEVVIGLDQPVSCRRYHRSPVA